MLSEVRLLVVVNFMTIVEWKSSSAWFIFSTYVTCKHFFVDSENLRIIVLFLKRRGKMFCDKMQMRFESLKNSQSHRLKKTLTFAWNIFFRVLFQFNFFYQERNKTSFKIDYFSLYSPFLIFFTTLCAFVTRKKSFFPLRGISN